MKYSEGLYAVLSRAMKIVPVYEGEMNEALGAKQIAAIDKNMKNLQMRTNMVRLHCYW